ncbi:MAG TPA: hypothetical protein VKR32_00955 [Puia sp.]|nr:hypothetical protein [Puia sp.]
MNKTNVQSVCDDLKSLGFDSFLSPLIRNSMAQNKISFELNWSRKFKDDLVTAVLSFIRPAPGGPYFFTGYRLIVGDRNFHFKTFAGKGITVKEGYNLLCGRAVYKLVLGRSGRDQYSWIQFDPEKMSDAIYQLEYFSGSRAFDLSLALDALAIRPPNPIWDFNMMIKSLRKGNLQPARLWDKGVLNKVMLEANPRQKIINIHPGWDDNYGSPQKKIESEDIQVSMDFDE